MGTISELLPMTCVNCGKKLAEVKIKEGIVSVKCGKCGVINTVETKPKSAKSTIG